MDDGEDGSWGANWKRGISTVKAQTWPTGDVYPGYHKATPVEEPKQSSNCYPAMLVSAPPSRCGSKVAALGKPTTLATGHNNLVDFLPVT